MDEQEIGQIRSALQRQPSGEFHFSDLYGHRWDELTIGDKVCKGNAFERAVGKGLFPDVEDTGRKNKGGRVYVRRSNA